jgi:sortase (surface protein transpeptidase)
VGWHNLSATPGHAGNTVLSGHNYSQGGKVFQKLWLLDIGDHFTVYTGDEAHTCHPTWTNAGRLIVVGKPPGQP